MSFRDFERRDRRRLDRSAEQGRRRLRPRARHPLDHGQPLELRLRATSCSTFDPSLFGPVANQPHVKGRKPYKNVAIANSDSGAFAYTHSAINEAYRAVQDLPG